MIVGQPLDVAMPAPSSERHLTSVHPLWAVAGGRVTLEGRGFDLRALPTVLIGTVPARIVFASSRALTVVVPDGVDGRVAVQLEGDDSEIALCVGTPVAIGLHQVDSPVFDRDGNLYVTYSGTRGDHAPVSIFRVGSDGSREPFASGIPNATSMAFDPLGQLYVSSRFEGRVYRVSSKGEPEVAATELGVASGIAFDADGTLFVGDRSGTIFRVDAAGSTVVHASLPPSIAAYHLAHGPDGCLYVTAPTLAPADVVYRIDPSGTVEIVRTGFGRPQGLGFDSQGTLHVVEALAGAAGLYRLPPGEPAEIVLAAAALVGVAFNPSGDIVVTSNDTAYRLSP